MILEHGRWYDIQTLLMVLGIMYSAAVANSVYDWAAGKLRMKVQVFHLFFRNDANGGLAPVDPELYSLATQYAAEYLAEPVDFTVYKNTWVACETDGQDKPVRVLGLLCMILRPDFPICRFIDNVAVGKLVQRANDHMHDLYGWRGCEALIHIKQSEEPGARCPNYQDWMKAFGLKPADRWVYKVR